MIPILQIGDYGWLLPYVPYPFIAAFVIFVFLNIDRVEKWSAKIAAAFSWISARAEKASVARDIQGRIYEFRRRPDYRFGLPYGLKIRWQKGETVAELKEGEVLVIMEEHKSQSRNFVNALTAYLAIASMPNVRPYCPSKVKRAVELVLEYKIILQERTDAVEIFKEETLTPETKADSELASLVDKLEEFERAGVFSRIFLREMVKYGDELKGAMPSSSDWVPINDLVDMLFGLVTQPRGVLDDRPFAVNHERMKFVIVRVASFHTLVTRGTDAHVDFAKIQMKDGFTRFYVWARGNYEREGRVVVSKMVNSGNFQLDDEDSYRVQKERYNNYLAEVHSVRPLGDAFIPSEQGLEEEPAIRTLGTGRQLLVSAILSLEQNTKYFDESEIGRALLDKDSDFSTLAYGVKSMQKFLSLYPDVLVRTGSRRANMNVYEIIIDRTQ